MIKTTAECLSLWYYVIGRRGEKKEWKVQRVKICLLSSRGFRIGGDRGGLAPWIDLQLVGLVRKRLAEGEERRPSLEAGADGRDGRAGAMGLPVPATRGEECSSLLIDLQATHTQ